MAIFFLFFLSQSVGLKIIKKERKKDKFIFIFLVLQAKRSKEAKNRQRISKDLRRAAAGGIPLPVVQPPSIVVLPVPFWYYQLPPLGIIPFQPPLPLLPLPPPRSALPASSTAALYQAGSSHQSPVSKQLIDDSPRALIHMQSAETVNVNI